MTRSYLPKELQLEGVDPLALVDVVTGIEHVAHMLAALPDRVRIGLVGHLEQQLIQPINAVPPLAKFVIDVTINACSDPATLDRIRAQLLHDVDPDQIAAARRRAVETPKSLAMALPTQLPGMNARPAEGKREPRAA